MSAAVGRGDGGNGGRAVFGCTGPLQPERCARLRIGGDEVREGGVRWGGGGGGGDQPLRTLQT